MADSVGSWPLVHLRQSTSQLSECAAEPIRTPGSIQPHGRLLVLKESTLKLVAFSGNLSREKAEAAASALSIRQLDSLEVGKPPISVGKLPDGDVFFDAQAHKTSSHVIVELERSTDLDSSDPPIYSLTRVLLPKLQEASSLAQLTRLAACEMKRLTGFGRCLVYRFNETGDGEVLAEELDAGYESYAEHRFPAADIPQQARDLYRLNQFRLIADADYVPVPLMAVDPSFGAEAIDLSQAQLRSVSPIHLEYMRNMGTLASMSVSIVIGGRLWGLVSCHDHAPRHLSMPTKLACEHLGQLLALQIRSDEVTSAVSEGLALRKITLAIVSHLSESDGTLQHLVREGSLMLRLTRSHGAAVVLDDKVWSVGDVPDEAHIQSLARWISGMGVEVYESSTLSAHFDGADKFRNAAGVLAVSISQVHRHLIIWFRPEFVQTVNWAGDPRKLAVSTDGRIHPRASFASWVEEIRGRSKPWSPVEIGAVAELRQALIGIVLRRAEELAAIASELGRVNKELEAFSYTVSHDLRAPMRHIAGYVDLVMDVEGKTLSDRAQRYLGQVKEASTFAGQLVDALLDFSRMSRSALKYKAVDSGVLVDSLMRELDRYDRGDREAKIEWDIAPDLPTLHADPLLLQVAVRNLMANAAKYSRNRSPAKISVRSARSEDGDGIEVEDNGVGFQMKYVDKLFGVFQRLHQAEEFEGTGIGLANVKRIVERHGGRVWAHGEVGRGARFGFVIPRSSTQISARPGEKNA
ncbi:ATP-binding protein [Variovorax sp. RHLX14]|uniref:ATP-binding protein n=1 Tax=Variovorax sp. RHLX14 TaxID=1259731 RepID=UPI003F45AAC0